MDAEEVEGERVRADPQSNEREDLSVRALALPPRTGAPSAKPWLHGAATARSGPTPSGAKDRPWKSVMEAGWSGEQKETVNRTPSAGGSANARPKRTAPT